MPLLQHLYELRDRLVKSALAILVGVILAFVFREQVFDFLKEPYCKTDLGKNDCNLYSTLPLEQFNVSLRVSFIAGFVGASPVWLYQLGAFITPALYRKEKRYATAFLAASLFFFVVGTVFAYLTLTQALDFLLGFSGDSVVALPTVSSYLSFVTLLMLAFGVAFEFPVILMFLNIVGLFPSAKMRAWRRGMIVFIAIASAVITPTTDPYTFSLMAIPLYVLYEVVIVLARVRERRKPVSVEPLYTDLADDEISPYPVAPAPVEAAAPVEPVTRLSTAPPVSASRQP
jgi:sec-independent protein translocase protein TatC